MMFDQLKLFFGRLKDRKALRATIGWQSRNKNAGIRTAISVDSDFQSNLRHFQCALGKERVCFMQKLCP